MISEAAPAGASTHPIVRSLAFVAAWMAVLSGLYHIAAIYLLPLPGEMHPNMHLLLAFVILLMGGAAAAPEVYGEKIRKLGFLPVLYAVSLLPAVFLFYFISELGEGWDEAGMWWPYGLPFLLWAAMMARERAWLALGLWLAGFLPAVLLWANWSLLPESVQEPTNWWLLLMSAIPAMWILFGVFFRPAEALRRTALLLIVLAAIFLLGGWRVALWAQQGDQVRSVVYLWPLLVLAVPGVWAWRATRDRFQGFPNYSYPAGLTVGLNTAMLLFVVTACLYLFYFHEEMVDRPGAPTFGDTRVGFVMIVVAFELTRRCFGPPLPTLAIIAVAYGLWGNLLGPTFGHGGHQWAELLAKLSTDFIGGVLGFLVVISATFIIMFLLLGAFLHESGAGRFFVNFALSLFGRMRAGAGLAAVGSSALMGTVSGSASGNVVTTGTFTIPLMKRIGLSPHIAGAAEAAASSGGQIMPPVMGAGAFIMSELIEVPYIQLIGYAAIPAFLYFTIVGINIHFAAGILDINPLPKEEIPDWKAELRDGWFYFVPLAFLVYFLFEGRTPVFAGVMSVFIMVGVWFYRNTAEFLGGLRQGESPISDGGFVFVPVTFWVYGFALYAVLSGLEAWFGWPLSFAGPVGWAATVKTAVILAVAGFGLATFLLQRVSGGTALWREIERGWPVIYPLGALGLWVAFGWVSGVAGAFLVLAALGIWAAVRGNGFSPVTLLPWLFFLIWLAAFGVQNGLYSLFPAASEFSEWFRPFGFIYHGVIFFALAAGIQQIIWAATSPRTQEDKSPPRVQEVVAVSCNPYFYLRKARGAGRDGPDVEAAERSAKWIDSIRNALRVGGRQGAEFGVTLATIEIVVQVLTITGVGNKFAYLIETLAQDVCLIGPAVGGGACGTWAWTDISSPCC